MNASRLYSVMALSVALVACGGGGDSGDAQQPDQLQQSQQLRLPQPEPQLVFDTASAVNLLDPAATLQPGSRYSTAPIVSGAGADAEVIYLARKEGINRIMAQPLRKTGVPSGPSHTLNVFDTFVGANGYPVESTDASEVRAVPVNSDDITAAAILLQNAEVTGQIPGVNAIAAVRTANGEWSSKRLTSFFPIDQSHPSAKQVRISSTADGSAIFASVVVAQVKTSGKPDKLQAFFFDRAMGEWVNVFNQNGFATLYGMVSDHRIIAVSASHFVLVANVLLSDGYNYKPRALALHCKLGSIKFSCFVKAISDISMTVSGIDAAATGGRKPVVAFTASIPGLTLATTYVSVPDGSSDYGMLTTKVSNIQDGVVGQPAIAMNDDGGIVVAWFEPRPFGKAALLVAHLNPEGAVIHGPTSIAEGAIYSNMTPALDVNASGKAVVGWLETRVGMGRSVFASRMLDTNTKKFTAAELIEGDLMDVDMDSLKASMPDDGTAILTWHQNGRIMSNRAK